MSRTWLAMIAVQGVLCGVTWAGWTYDGTPADGSSGSALESDPIYATGGVARTTLTVVGDTTSRWDSATQELSVFGDGGGTVTETDPVYATGGVARAALTVDGDTMSAWDPNTQTLYVWGDGVGGGGDGITNGTPVAELGGMTLSNRHVLAEETAGGVTGRANVWQAAPVASAAAWTAVSNGATYFVAVTTQTVMTAAVTGSVVSAGNLVVTEVNDTYPDWQMPPYNLEEDYTGMWREETSGDYFYLYWEDMEGFYVLVMNGMMYCVYSNTASAGTFGPYGMTQGTGTVVVTSGVLETNDLYGFAETETVVTSSYAIARHLREADRGFHPVFEMDVTSTMSTASDGVQEALDFVLQASTNSFDTVCYVYASFGTSLAEQGLYGEGHWFEEDGADFGGVCLALPTLSSRWGPTQKSFTQSLKEFGAGLMDSDMVSPTLLTPGAPAAWMTPGNSDLHWRVRRFNGGDYIEEYWRMVRPVEWRVTPLGYQDHKRFGGWEE